MSIRMKIDAALFVSAAFLYSTIYSSATLAQAPIVDASTDASGVEAAATTPAEDNSQQGAGGLGQSELFYQLQLLQQEVMQLRGIVEEQAYTLKQVKEQSMERYIDLDRRFGEFLNASATVPAPAKGPGAPKAPASGLPVDALAGEKAAYDNAYSLVTARRFDDALEAFKQFLMDFPGGKYAPNSHYWMGELYQVITPKNLEAARQSFTQLLDQYPGHPKAPDAMYKLGKVYFLKGNPAKSKAMLEKVIAEYGKGTSSSAAEKARQFMNANF